MVRIHRVPQPQSYTQAERRTQQHRKMMERDDRPQPRAQIKREQNSIDRNYSTAQILRAIIEQSVQLVPHFFAPGCRYPELGNH